MDNSDAVVPSGAYGIPKWIMKKGMRYEVDDFIVSPPSHEDGSFLRLRYGRCPSPRLREEAADDGGQDRGMTVEVRDGDTLLSGDGDTAATTTTTTTITIGPGGLSVEASPLSTPDSASVDRPDVHPLLVLPMNFGGDTKFTIKSKAATSSTSSTPKAEFDHLVTESTTSDNIVKHPKPTRKISDGALFDKSGLVKKVHGLSVVSPGGSQPPSPITSPLPTPKTSPQLQRKVMGVTMDSSTPQRKISAHTYFCTKPFQEGQGGANTGATLTQETVQYSSTVRTQQLEEGAKAQVAIDPTKHFMGKRRQPKPSTLREMNFWAPTSM